MPKHSSNICSFHVLKENKINRGISEHSSVQTTISNHAKSQKSSFFKKSPKFHFLRFFKNNTPKRSFNICLFHVPKENNIHQRIGGISEHSSVQSTITNLAKYPKSQLFKKSHKFQFLRFFTNNTPKHSSIICLFHVPKENKIHRGTSEHLSVQSSAPRCRQTDRRTDGQTDRRTWFIGLIIPLNV